MADLASDFGFSAGTWRGAAGYLIPLALCLAVLVVLPGCGGCRKTPEQVQAEREKKEAERRAEEKEKEQKKKPDVETGMLASLPCESNPKFCPYKPGHWTATTLPAKANHFDLWGDLETTVVDGRGKAIALLGMPYTSTGSREVALPKGQPKSLQSVLYVPPTGRDAFVLGRIHARKGGRGTYEQRHLNLRRMPSYQYHFVVLARWPQSYNYLDSLDSVKYPSDLAIGESAAGFYRVHLLRTNRQTTLPPHALFWTSIAYILWDDGDPAALRPDQQQALLDWLHWGGGLIVSGPDSLDALRSSFLGPSLPATSAGTRELTAADFQQLSAYWTNRVGNGPGRQLAPVTPWAGVKFDVHPQAREVPNTGGLVVERRVGRGRIVVSAFDLDGPGLTSWPSFDGFFNGCLLGRPPRRFREDDFEVQVTWARGGFDPHDPRAVCQLRYFTRDTGKPQTAATEEPGDRYGRGFRSVRFPVEAPRRFDGPGVASWSDFNSVANSARDALTSAARIEIPDRTFVVWVVGAYLLVLVPANWLVFRSINRVAWAWAAAPVIAVACTFVVIRLAQLDIGFARSMTEIAVVETQGDYPRAHVTRYTALYTSLATTYDFRLEDPGAQVQPFPNVARPGDLDLLPGQGLTKLQYRYGRDGVRMRGFHVSSNTTGLVHSEQMADLGGPISLADESFGGYVVTNGTDFTLYGAGVVRRNESGLLETAWAGTLRPGDSVPLRFSRRPDTRAADRLWPNQRDRSPLTAAMAPHGLLSLSRLVDLAEDVRELRPGDVRLVGWLAEEIPGLEVRPVAPQSRRAALVVAHLRYGFGEAPQPDEVPRRTKADDYRSFGPDSPQAQTE